MLPFSNFDFRKHNRSIEDHTHRKCRTTQATLKTSRRVLDFCNFRYFSHHITPLGVVSHIKIEKLFFLDKHVFAHGLATSCFLFDTFLSVWDM
jgi:hypothetical protein